MRKIVDYTLICGSRETVVDLIKQFLTEDPIFELYGTPCAGQEYDETTETWLPVVYQAMVKYEKDS